MNILSYTNIYKHEHMFFATFDIMLEGKCISYYAEQNKKFTSDIKHVCNLNASVHFSPYAK